LGASILSVSFAQEPAFSTKIEAVRVDVLVTDNGRPVRGLGPSDFEVLDNGVLQQVDLVSFEPIALNVVLALDMSDSVAGERLEHLRAAGNALLSGLKPEDQTAVIAFSHVVSLGAGLTKDLSQVREALDSVQPSGDTSLVDGSYAAITVGESDVGRALVIVFSDGLDTTSWLPAEAVLDIAKRSDVVVYGVAAGSRKPQFLAELSSLTGGRVFEVDKTSNLTAIFLGVLEEFRHRYLVSYTPRGVARDGWHELSVRVKRKATVKARHGYLAGSF
jgi:VWFA-related protein